MSRQQIIGPVVILATIFFSSTLLAELPAISKQFDTSNSQLRSAFVGSDVWGNENLSSDQIDDQLKLHFQSVLRILNAQTESSLSKAVAQFEQHYGLELSQNEHKFVRQYLAAKRSWQIRTLKKYADRGQFPRNEGYADEAVPIFVDRHGTHCAVGYLMHCSGHDDKVAVIVQRNNLVRVNDVGNGPLVDWAIVSGLTQAEAALIQPSYLPPIQALLSDYQDPNFSLSRYGLTVSDLTVVEYSYDGGDNIEAAFNIGVNEVSSLGASYDRPDNFGIAIGEGDYVSFTTFEPKLSHWIFLGGTSFGPVGIPDPGDNSIMRWINYRVQADSGSFNEFGVTSSGLFNYNEIQEGSSLRVTTQILTPDMMLKSQGTLQSDSNGPFNFLNGSAFMDGTGTDFWVSTYALDYSEPGSLGASNFLSIFNEVQVVPEPSSFSVTFVLLCLTSSLRRRRVSREGKDLRQ